MSDFILRTPQTGSVFAGPFSSIVHVVQSGAAWILARRRKAKIRKILNSLTEEQIKDIGMDRSLVQPGPRIVVGAREMAIMKSYR